MYGSQEAPSRAAAASATMPRTPSPSAVPPAIRASGATRAARFGWVATSDATIAVPRIRTMTASESAIGIS